MLLIINDPAITSSYPKGSTKHAKSESMLHRNFSNIVSNFFKMYITDRNTGSSIFSCLKCYRIIIIFLK